MRLTQSEKEELISAISPFLNGINAELRLYGSRVNDSLKGGDIDLLLLLDHEKSVDTIKLQKHMLLSAIKKRLGDRKVDVLIASRDTMTSDTFLTMIVPESIVLHIWSFERPRG